MNEGEVLKAQAEAVADLVVELREDNERLKAELERDDEAMDALEVRVEELEGELAGEKANSALLERMLYLRAKHIFLGAEITPAANIQLAKELRATAAERDKYRGALEQIVKQGYKLIGFDLPFEYALIEAEKILYPVEFEYKGGDE